MAAPVPDPVPGDDKLPEKVDVVIIGGGIIGASAAYFLAERGVSVALCEKGVVAGEQSSRNWGWCRQQGRDPRELPLVIESLKLWRTLDQRIGEKTGFRQCGILYLSDTPDRQARREAWLEHARQHQLYSKIVGPDDIAELLPGAARRWAGGVHTPDDGRAEPQMAAPALARGARTKGAAVLTGCAVRGIETSAGRLSAVVTERGRIACSAAVLAGGAWSFHFCRNIGISLPQLTVRASVFRTSPVDNAPETATWAPGFTFRKRLDGGYTIANGDVSIADLAPQNFRYMLQFRNLLTKEIRSVRLMLGRRFVDELMRPRHWALDRPSPFESCRILDPAPVPWILDKAAANLRAAFPVFRSASIVESWAGYIDTTPDAIPVISELATQPGFFVATGFSGHGFGLGPGAGRLIADLTTGADPVVDPAPFRFSRFTDGSNPKPFVGL